MIMSKNQFNTLKSLHCHHRPLVLMNVWDAASAAMVQDLGAKAIATSSASLAWANGYADGGGLPIQVLLDAIGRIKRVTQVPLTVDIEAGYSESPEQVATLVAKLVSTGVCGINIEDGEQAPDLLADKIAAIMALVGTESVFINARTDVYLRQLVEPEQRVATCIERAACYAQAGAHGFFVPGLLQADEVTAVTADIELPLNVMDTDSQPDLCQWRKLEVSRISMGPAPFLNCYAGLWRLSGSENQGQAWSYEYANKLFL